MAEANIIRAAGGVLWRTAKGPKIKSDIEVAIIHRPRYGDWSIPKGKLVPGESEIEGAIREVTEETGYRVQIRQPLGTVEYVKNAGATPRTKVVRFWSMHAEGGMFSPSHEVDELRWVSVEQAHELLTHERDKRLLSTFAREPIVTRTVLLVRHGSAGSRSDWTGVDKERPLDEAGRAQAEALVWLLTRFDVRQIVSADYVRCVQTMEPLSGAVGLPIADERLFSEDGYPGSERKAEKTLRGIGGDGAGSVVCSQGNVIPDLIRRIASQDGTSLSEPIVAKKGSTWSLTFAEGKLHAAEYFAPLA